MSIPSTGLHKNSSKDIMKSLASKKTSNTIDTKDNQRDVSPLAIMRDIYKDISPSKYSLHKTAAENKVKLSTLGHSPSAKDVLNGTYGQNQSPLRSNYNQSNSSSSGYLASQQLQQRMTTLCSDNRKETNYSDKPICLYEQFDRTTLNNKTQQAGKNYLDELNSSSSTAPKGNSTLNKIYNQQTPNANSINNNNNSMNSLKSGKMKQILKDIMGPDTIDNINNMNIYNSLNSNNNNNIGSKTQLNKTDTSMNMGQYQIQTSQKRDTAVIKSRENSAERERVSSQQQQQYQQYQSSKTQRSSQQQLQSHLQQQIQQQQYQQQQFNSARGNISPLQVRQSIPQQKEQFLYKESTTKNYNSKDNNNSNNKSTSNPNNISVSSNTPNSSTSNYQQLTQNNNNRPPSKQRTQAETIESIYKSSNKAIAPKDTRSKTPTSSSSSTNSQNGTKAETYLQQLLLGQASTKHDSINSRNDCSYTNPKNDISYQSNKNDISYTSKNDNSLIYKKMQTSNYSSNNGNEIDLDQRRLSPSEQILERHRSLQQINSNITLKQQLLLAQGASQQSDIVEQQQRNSQKTPLRTNNYIQNTPPPTQRELHSINSVASSQNNLNNNSSNNASYSLLNSTNQKSSSIQNQQQSIANSNYNNNNNKHSNSMKLNIQQQLQQQNKQITNNNNLNSDKLNQVEQNQLNSQNNKYQHLKKVDGSRESDNQILKAIQEQLKDKHLQQQKEESSYTKQKKLSTDLLDSTYFQFNAQAIQQYQQESHNSSINMQIDYSKKQISSTNRTAATTQDQNQIITRSTSQHQQLSSQGSQSSTANSSFRPTTPSQQQKQLQTSIKQYDQEGEELERQNTNNNLKQLVKQNEKQQELGNQKSENSSVNASNIQGVTSNNVSQISTNSRSSILQQSSELSQSIVDRVDINDLMTIEQSLYNLSKTQLNSKNNITHYSKQYLSVIAEESLDQIQKLFQCNEQQSSIINKVFILERVTVVLALTEALKITNSSNINNNDNSDTSGSSQIDEDTEYHIQHSLQYVHLNYLLFLDVIMQKFNEYESQGLKSKNISSTKSINQKNEIKKLFKERSQNKRVASVLAKQDKFQIMSNYCEIILPYLKNVVVNYDQEPFSVIQNIIYNINTATVAQSTQVLMDSFSKIIVDMEEKVSKESKFSNGDSVSESSTGSQNDISFEQKDTTQKKKVKQPQQLIEKENTKEENKQKSQDQPLDTKKQTTSSNSTTANKQSQENQKKNSSKNKKYQYEETEEDDYDEEEEEDEVEDPVVRGSVPAPYLPILKESNKYTLVLDLDETLVHYQEIPNEGGQFLIRPNAEVFLQVMAQHYEIVIFTAAIKEYADFILDVINNNSISHRLYRQHTSTDGRNYIKDLSKLGRELSKTIIIDNLPENFSRQPKNGILIQSWYGEADDRALFDLIPLLTEVTKSKKYTDVRDALQKYREQMIKNLMNGVQDPHIHLDLDNEQIEEEEE